MPNFHLGTEEASHDIVYEFSTVCVAATYQLTRLDGSVSVQGANKRNWLVLPLWLVQKLSPYVMLLGLQLIAVSG